MSDRDRLSVEAIDAFLAKSAGWEREPGREAIGRTFAFGDYAAGIAFAVRVGFAAEAKDHHPDLHVGWRKVRVVWATHDAGGVTGLDVAMAAATDALAG
jgi:4a-hydroxytetrahydrobiopterin dehydratase